MSRETLLDDAIAKAKEAEDWQLVEWLRMARSGESAARWYTAKLGEARLDMSKLMAENAKLRELVVEVFECARRGAACETCKVNNDGYACVYIMRELGVEVEE